MQLILKRYWGVFLILTVAIIGINERPYYDQELLNSASGETVSAQVGRDVQDSLDTLKTSATLKDWRASGFLPGDVMKNALALRRKEAKGALCSSLKGLSPKDLSVFEPALNTAEVERKFNCTSHLLEEIQDYWANQIQAADARRVEGGVPSIPLIERTVPRNSVHEINSSLLQNGEFALVFEGGLDPVQTREILKTLDEHDAKAFFLVSGASARDHSDLLQTITKMGNILGSQSLNSMDLTTLPMSESEKQISDGVHAVSIAGDSSSPFFSFPLSASNEPLVQMVETKGLKIVRADLDSEDWKHYDPVELTKAVNARTDSNQKGIILFHDLLRQTAIAMPAILDHLATTHRKLVVFDVK